MSDVTIGADAFSSTIDDLLKRLDGNVRDNVPEAVEEALKTGQEAWKRNATSVLSASYSRGGWGRKRAGAKVYKSGPRKGKVKEGWYGKTYRTGKYARSIRHQMLSEGRDEIAGEIGSPTLPGLAHLLEKGHAMVGGGKTKAYEHIAPAYDEAADEFTRLADSAIERAINDA